MRANKPKAPCRIKPYRKTRQADLDIADIYVRGCREHGQSLAERYHAGLARTFELLAEHPRIARERTEFNPRVRLHPYQAHLIIYLLDESGVVIVRVLHRRQDWEGLLS